MHSGSSRGGLRSSRGCGKRSQGRTRQLERGETTTSHRKISIICLSQMQLSRLVPLNSEKPSSDSHIGSSKTSFRCCRSRQGNVGRRRFAPDETDGWSIRESAPEPTHREGNHHQCFLLGIQSVRCTAAGLRRD